MGCHRGATASAWKIPRSARLCLSSSRALLLLIPHLGSNANTGSLALRNDRPSFPVVSYNMYVHRFSFSYVTNCCTPSLYQQPSPSTAIGLEIPLLFLQSHPGILLYSHDFIASKPWECRISTTQYHLHVEPRVPSSVTAYSLSLNPLGYQFLLLVPSDWPCLLWESRVSMRQYHWNIILSYSFRPLKNCLLYLKLCKTSSKSK